MKKLLWLCLPALPLLAAAVPGARADGITDASCGLNFHLNVNCGPVVQAGPWYLYWPLQAHFQNPAPIGFPFWATRMTAGPLPVAQPAPPPYAAPAPAVVPQNGAAAYGAPSAIQQVRGYYSQEPVPEYWYRR